MSKYLIDITSFSDHEIKLITDTLEDMGFPLDISIPRHSTSKYIAIWTTFHDYGFLTKNGGNPLIDIEDLVESFRCNSCP